jgi:outer membrane lipoprotein SlyB
MKKTTLKAIVFMLVTAVCAGMISGCAGSRSGQVYSRHDARQVHVVEYGIVESVRPVRIEGTRSGAGTVAGAVAGGVLGSAIGSGTGRAVSTTIGAIAGALAGSSIEEDVTARDGLEIVINMDSGQTIVIVQEADIDIWPGDRVKVLTGPYGNSRVTY